MENKRKSIHYGFVIIICCCLMMGVNIGLSFSCAGIFYKPVSESLGVGVGLFGIYMSVMYVAATLFLPFAGKLLERYSARWLFAGSSALMGLVFLAFATLNAVWEFYAVAVALGVSVAFQLYLSFPTLVNRWFSVNVGLMMGICTAASGIGGMLFSPLIALMITDWGWRWAYAACGLLILPCWRFCYAPARRRRDCANMEREAPRRSVRQMPRLPRVTTRKRGKGARAVRPYRGR